MPLRKLKIFALSLLPTLQRLFLIPSRCNLYISSSCTFRFSQFKPHIPYRQHGQPPSSPCFYQPRRWLAQLQQPPPGLQSVGGDESRELLQPPAFPPLRPSGKRVRTRVPHPSLAPRCHAPEASGWPVKTPWSSSSHRFVCRQVWHLYYPPSR